MLKRHNAYLLKEFQTDFGPLIFKWPFFRPNHPNDILIILWSYELWRPVFMSQKKNNITINFLPNFEPDFTKLVTRFLSYLNEQMPELVEQKNDACPISLIPMTPEQVDLLEAQGMEYGAQFQCGYKKDGSKVAYLSIDPDMPSSKIQLEVLKAILQANQFGDDRYPLLDIEQPLLSAQDYAAAVLCVEAENKAMLAMLTSRLKDMDPHSYEPLFHEFKDYNEELIEQFEKARASIELDKSNIISLWYALGDDVVRTDSALNALSYYENLRLHLLDNGMDVEEFVQGQFEPKEFFANSPLKISEQDLSRLNDDDLIFTGIDFKTLEEYGEFTHYNKRNRSYSNRDAHSDTVALIHNAGVQSNFRGPRKLSRFDQNFD